MPNITSLQFFIPEFVLAATALALLVLALFNGVAAELALPTLGRATPRQGSGHGFAATAAIIAIAGLLVSLIFVLDSFNVGTPPLFWGMLQLDKSAAFFKALFVIAAIIVIIFSTVTAEFTLPVAAKFTLPRLGRASSAATTVTNAANNDSPEYYALIIGSVIGMNLLASANNILMIYLSLEFVSLMSYMLVGCVRNSPRSSEAALKYVLYGAAASGVFLYGASLYYGVTGSLDINNFLTTAPSNYRTIALSGLFMLAGFLYKIAAVPMQAWCPDAYEGAPTPIAAFLSVAPKAAGFAILMRVSQRLGPEFDWPVVIAVVSAVTMTFGNLAAIPQTNLKRLLAYSSIAHAGYLLMGVACMTAKGNEAVYFYFIAYLVMNLGAFLVVQIVANNPLPHSTAGVEKSTPAVEWGESLDAYKGLGRRGTYGAVLGIAMTIFLLSLTGVPPFVGFIGKFYIFSAVIDARLYWLAVIGIINSVISLYYYMRVVRAMFFDSPQDTSQVPVTSKRLGLTMAFLAVATVVLGLAWQPISLIVAGL